jgi:hypothetical protein
MTQRDDTLTTEGTLQLPRASTVPKDAAFTLMDCIWFGLALGIALNGSLLVVLMERALASLEAIERAELREQERSTVRTPETRP